MATKKVLTKDEQITKEMKRLNDILKKHDLDDNKLAVADGLIQEAAFMRATLQELKVDINVNGAVDEMPQGDYSIKRESPSVKTYNTMIQRYTAACKEIFNLLPKEVKKEEDDGFDAFLKQK